jgi:hypothetical protein
LIETSERTNGFSRPNLLAMAPVRRLTLTLLLALCVAALGCGGSRERGKNQDHDRPTTKR